LREAFSEESVSGALGTQIICAAKVKGGEGLEERRGKKTRIAAGEGLQNPTLEGSGFPPDKEKKEKQR